MFFRRVLRGDRVLGTTEPHNAVKPEDIRRFGVAQIVRMAWTRSLVQKFACEEFARPRKKRR